ncbi:MAG: hypothetical protein CBC55_01500 [Gammaproteobacteria bacterium TMED95]|nr:MAG: hypothetical protein CBC55_01500 [Gammaproteobacteria bacterium TMED95]|tara:strand:+ start:2010 stop:2348 length:339 start_codon:yes stop_codon:yes gene_type:complete
MIVGTNSAIKGLLDEVAQKISGGRPFTEHELVSLAENLAKSGHCSTLPTDKGYPFTVFGYDFHAGKSYMIKIFAEDSLDAAFKALDDIPCTVNSQTIKAHLPDGIVYMPSVS